MRRYTGNLEQDANGQYDWQESHSGDFVKAEVAHRLQEALETIWNDGACHDLGKVGDALDFADDN